MQEDTRYYLLKHIHDNPNISQRELAAKAGISLGKTNYCLRALIEKGLIKADNFRKNSNKAGYLYVLTPKGIEEKARVTFRFWKRKQKEYERLKAELEVLSQEVQADLDQKGKQN